MPVEAKNHPALTAAAGPTTFGALKDQPDAPRSRTKRILAFAGFPLLVVAVVVPAVIFRAEIWSLFTSVQKLTEWVRASGPVAPLVFIAIQVFQIIVFIVPGEVVQITGGYLFGIWPATLYSVTGIAIGSAAAFFLARALGIPFVNALFSAQKVEGARKLLSTRGSKLVFFLLFVIPGIPKDVLCYVAGLSPLRFPFFIAASMAGRLPGIVGSALIGNSAAQKRWVLAAIIMGAAVILFAVGFLFRDRIEKLLRRIGARRGD
jgi:uncharacterized membrane protein YdjX (TVP38/TMEM64 family)